jgi:hypothetical protein
VFFFSEVHILNVFCVLNCLLIILVKKKKCIFFKIEAYMLKIDHMVKIIEAYMIYSEQIQLEHALSVGIKRS